MRTLTPAASQYDPLVRDLVSFSVRVSTQRELQKRVGMAEVSADSTAQFGSIVSYSDPLSPLRHRDVQALSEIFSADYVPDVISDVHQYLSHLYPEPCWEVEPYDFLKDYL